MLEENAIINHCLGVHVSNATGGYYLYLLLYYFKLIIKL